MFAFIRNKLTRIAELLRLVKYEYPNITNFDFLTPTKIKTYRWKGLKYNISLNKIIFNKQEQEITAYLERTFRQELQIKIKKYGLELQTPIPSYKRIVDNLYLYSPKIGSYYDDVLRHATLKTRAVAQDITLVDLSELSVREKYEFSFDQIGQQELDLRCASVTVSDVGVSFHYRQSELACEFNIHSVALADLKLRFATAFFYSPPSLYSSQQLAIPTISAKLFDVQVVKSLAPLFRTSPTISPTTKKRVSRAKKPTRKIDPFKRGGRHRGKVGEIEEKIKTDRGPELVCWKSEREWVLGIETPENFPPDSSLTINQDSINLQRDEGTGCWVLADIGGKIEIQSEEDTEFNYKMSLDRNYHLFKLYGKNLDQGRKVKSVSQGCYLAVVPKNWERDEKAAGPPPIIPEPTSFRNYTSHFFFISDQNKRIVFRDPYGRKVTLASRKYGFELVGNLVIAASEEWGPLFGETPPQLRCLDIRVWHQISTIILGSEGPGVGRWRKKLLPPDADDTRGVCCDVEEHGDGWYFVRIYDTNEELRDSLDFYFIKGLRKISQPKASPFPHSDGHQYLKVEFLHESECTVSAECECACRIPIEQGRDRTVLNIAPDPSLDKSIWLVGNGRQVEVPVHLDRIWWGYGSESQLPVEWSDKPSRLTRRDFKATSSRTLWVRLPQKRFSKRIFVGFSKKYKALAFTPRVDEELVPIPLRDLGECQELLDVTSEYNLMLWLDAISGHAILGVVETPKLHCKLCDYEAESEHVILIHVLQTHLDEYVEEVTDYSAFKLHDASLPKGIYQCGYCPKYVKSSSYSDPTGSIYTHIQYKCQKAALSGSPIKVTFSVVSDPDIIRRNVIRNLPHLYECKICFRHFANPKKGELEKHLRISHRNALYYY